MHETLDSNKFVPHICAQALNGNQRSQPLLLTVVSEVCEIVNEEKPLAMKKYVFPMMYKLVEKMGSMKHDLKASLHELIGKLYEACGEKFVTSFPSGQRDEVRSVLVALNC